MSKEAKLIESLKKAFGSMIPVQIFPAEVAEVDEAAASCTVKPVSGPEIFDVRIKAAINDKTDGLVIVPVVGSFVLVGIIGNDPETAYIAKYDSIDKIVMHGGNLGGIVKVQEVVNKLNALEQDLNNLKTVFSSSWTPVPNDGGAALKTAAATWSGSTITETAVADLENPKIKH